MWLLITGIQKEKRKECNEVTFFVGSMVPTRSICASKAILPNEIYLIRAFSVLMDPPERLAEAFSLEKTPMEVEASGTPALKIL